MNKYNKLTPIDDVDLGEYQSMLDFVMKEDDLQNIAITGVYGAGKSSVLKTYEDQNEEKKFFHIFLAMFMSDEILEQGIESSESVFPQQETIIEGKILNQLLHKIDYTKIPLTNFKVKKDISKGKVALNVLILVAFIFSTLGLIFFESLAPFPSCLVEGNINWPKTIFIGIFLLSTLGIVYFLVNLFQYNRVISKLTIQGNSIEILEESKSSIFDKNLNEVLYLFENVEADVIVFEDLDRYNTNQIFIKLREINKLLNDRFILSKKKKGKGFTKDFKDSEEKDMKKHSNNPIKFFYVLRDDVFTTTDRTKFFDFIIPIVPVVDVYNAKEKLEKQLLDENLSPSFLRGIAFYIQEMRLLYNIVNEYYVYFDKVESKKGEKYQNKEKLLAMVTYKNIFPRDFTDLQKNQGYVATLLTQHKSGIFIQKQIEQLDLEISRAEKKIEETKNLIVKNKTELYALYFDFTPYSNSNYRINSKAYNAFLNNFERMGAMLKCDAEIGYYSGSSWYDKSSQFKQEIEKIDKNPEFQERLSILENRDKEIQEKESLSQKKKELEKATLKEIIREGDKESIFENVVYSTPTGEKNEFKEIKDSPCFGLIKFLISDGYIDERTYKDYLSIFYEGSLTITDKNFVQSCITREPLPFDYHLNRCEAILLELYDVDFENLSILNYDLLTLIIKDHKESELKKIAKLICSDKKLDFIDGFITSNIKSDKNTQSEVDEKKDKDIIAEENIKITKDFVIKINEFWSDIWSYILENADESFDKLSYAKLTLNVCGNIKDLNENNVLSDYVSKQSLFLAKKDNAQIYSANILAGAVSELGIKFREVDVKNSNAEFIKQIYLQCNYEITEKNILTFLEEFYKISINLDEMQRKGYSHIASQEDQALYKYIHSNMSIFIDQYVKQSNQEIDDDEKYVLQILNNKEFEFYENEEEDKQNEIDGKEDGKEKSYRRKKAYIEKLTTQISDLNEVEDKGLWPILLENSKVEENEENIVSYYVNSENQIDSFLVGFINASEHEYHFDDHKISGIFGDETARIFFESLVFCNELEIEKYENIFKFFYNSFKKFPEKTNLNNERLEILINYGMIRGTQENLLVLRKNYADVKYIFIKKHIDTYIKEWLSTNFNLDEAKDLLDEDLSNDQKIEILNHIGDPISVQNEKYSSEVKAYILENNFNEEDFSYLIEHYSDFTENAKEIIFSKCIEKIETEDFFDKQKIAPQLLERIYTAEDVSTENKMSIFSKHIPLNIETVRKHLSLINSNVSRSFLKLLEKGKQVSNQSFDNTDNNKKILQLFQNRDWIGKIKVDPRNELKLRVWGNKRKF